MLHIFIAWVIQYNIVSYIEKVDGMMVTTTKIGMKSPDILGMGTLNIIRHIWQTATLA